MGNGGQGPGRENSAFPDQPRGGVSFADREREREEEGGFACFGL